MFDIHKIFGIKENVNYTTRIGAYVIPVKDNMIGVIETPKGYFLIGGGKEDDETNEQCIKRECLEETGYDITIKKKLCSAELYTKKKSVILTLFRLIMLAKSIIKYNCQQKQTKNFCGLILTK